MALMDKMKKMAAQVSGASGAKVVINKLISEYGKVCDLEINKAEHSIIASVLLDGESTPIAVKIEEYEIIKTEAGTSVVVKSASSDKAWLNTGIKNFLIGKAWNIPEKATPFLDGLIG